MSRDNQGFAFKKPQRDLEAFIEGGEPANASPPVEEPPPAPPEIVPAPPASEPDSGVFDAPVPQPELPMPKRARYRRSDGREQRKRSFYVDAELDKRFAAFCATHGSHVGPMIEYAIQKLLAEHAQR